MPHSNSISLKWPVLEKIDLITHFTGSVVGKLPLRKPADGEQLSLRVVKGTDLLEVDQESRNLSLAAELDRDEVKLSFPEY